MNINDYKIKPRNLGASKLFINNLNNNYMGKVIQQIPTNDGESLYLIDYNKETEELTFRTSRVPEHLQTEKITFRGNDVCTNLYFFNKTFLINFLDNQ